MEIVRYKNPVYEDVVSPITEADRQDPAFVEAEQRVEAAYQEIGARVLCGKADAGQPPGPPKFSDPHPQSAAMTAFNNRPA